MRPAVLAVAGGAVLLAIMWSRRASAGQSAAAAVGGAVGGAVVDMVGGVLTGVDAALPEAVRPSSDQNIFYRAASAPFASSGDTLGTWLYSVFNE